MHTGPGILAVFLVSAGLCAQERAEPAAKGGSPALSEDQIRDLLPATLLSCEEEGPNSRERDFPLRLTF